MGAACHRLSGWAAAVLAVGVFLAGLVASPAHADPPVASFSISPAAPLTGEPVVFTSTSTGTVTGLSWDLDGDGGCNDATGGTAQRTFPVPGPYLVKLCANGPDGNAAQVRRITVLNRPPVASFTLMAAAPRAREPVTFVSTAADPDGPIATLEWDLDGDGVYGDASGIAVAWTYARAGTYPVGLRVIDASGAEAVTTQPVTIARAALPPMTPAPLVRLAGRITPAGIVVTRLAVQAAPRVRVSVRCTGGRRLGCRFRRLDRVLRGRVWRVRRAEGFLAAGSTLKVLIRRPRTIGKYTRFAIRGAGAPRRIDLCLPPKPARPQRCPSE